ncbi:MAG: peroxiredoxin family protein [Prevotellaceae bacterium]|jgi:thioredoxin-related protein|nr:peroxiredoxin family protein [Prevotellaceae bacterium]
MNRKTIFAVVLAAIFIVFAVLILLKSVNQTAQAQHPQRLPAFCFLNLRHESLTIDTVDCAHSVVIFYSPGCAFCEHEGAELSRNAERFAGCKLFFVTMEPLDSAKAYTARHQLLSHTGYYSLVDTTRLAVLEFGVRTIPTTFIYDRDKNLIKVLEGEINAKRLAKVIAEGK